MGQVKKKAASALGCFLLHASSSLVGICLLLPASLASDATESSATERRTMQAEQPLRHPVEAPSPGPVAFEIPSQAIALALIQFGEQAGTSVLIQHEASGVETAGLTGAYPPLAGLERLLAGTGLDFRVTEAGIAVFRQAAHGSANEAVAASAKTRTSAWGRIAALFAGLALGGGAGSAAAQAGETDGGSYYIEEIVVTAQKREQNIQDVGSSITAFSGEQYRELGFENAASVAAQTPNFSFGQPAGEGTNTTLSIRGVGLNTVVDSIEGAVAMYVDEVYQGTLAAQGVSMFDVERVEVLRGPQGTLYGRNTTGGLVHFISRRPSEQFEAFGQLTYGTHDQVRFEGAAGGPLSDNLRARLSYYHNQNDGNQVDRANSRRGSVVNIDAVRGQLDIDLSSEANLLLKLQLASVDNTPTLYKHRGLLTAPAFAGGVHCEPQAVLQRQCVDLFGYRDADPDPRSHETNADTAPYLKNEVWGASAKLTWGRNGWEAVSVTAVQNVDKDHLELPAPTPAAPVESNWVIDSKQFSQEFRISNSSDRLTWMLGAYYYSDEKPGNINVPSFDTVPVFGFPIPPLPGDLFYTTDYSQDTETAAVFGHLNWNLTEQLELKLGLRWTDEKKTLDFSVVDSGFFQVPDPEFSLSDTFKTNAPSWNLGLNWFAGDETMLFANVARGIKTGGFNSGTIVTTPFQLQPFDDETMLMYEAGVKTTQIDGRLRANLTAFINDYEDFQALTSADAGGLGLPVPQLTNAGNVLIAGFEAELAFSPVDFFEVLLGLGYLDTETKDFISFTGLDSNGEPRFEDFSGSELTLSPKLSYNGVFRFRQPLLGGEGSLQVDFTHSDEYYFHTNNEPINVGGDFTIWNARAAWQSNDGRYEIAVFARNLSDEEYIVEGFEALEMQSLIYNGNDRTFGISLAVWR